MSHKKTQNTVNRNIWVLRNRKGISLREAAEELKIDQRTLNSIEYGNTEPKASVLLSICEFYEVPDMKKLITELV